MTDARSILDEQLRLPEDLRHWVDERALVSFVFDALHSVEQEPKDPQSEESLPPGRPRTLLSLLTYSYAIGLYGSDEIESHLATDPQLLYLAANTQATGNELRRFRRYHRSFLQQSLSRLLELAWQSQRDSQRSEQPRTEVTFKALFAQAAEERINRAVLTDTMALDQ